MYGCCHCETRIRRVVAISIIGFLHFWVISWQVGRSIAQSTKKIKVNEEVTIYGTYPG